MRSPANLSRVLLTIWLLLAGSSDLSAQKSDPPSTATAPPTIEETLRLARGWLVQQQHANGAFAADGALTHTVGVTSMATLALVRTEFDGRRDEATDRALDFLRSLPEERLFRTHEISLLIMALVTANDEQGRPKRPAVRCPATRPPVRTAAGEITAPESIWFLDDFPDGSSTRPTSRNLLRQSPSSQKRVPQSAS